MGFLDHIRRCNAHDLSAFVPWTIGGRRAGYLRPALARRLAGFPGVFEGGADGIALSDRLADPPARTAAVAEVLARLREEGLGGPRRDEPYAVAERVGGPALMEIDRGAAGPFGIVATGFHLNGVVGAGPDAAMWIARRARDKATFPGLLDNMVAGGQPANLGLAENLLKECREEADIPEDLAARARPAGLVSYAMEAPEGLRRHAMYVYDLDVPADFRPRPRDGEVEDFRLAPIAEVAGIVRDSLDAFKFNCALVAIDFLVRRGYLAPDSPGYFEIAAGLRRPLP